MKKFTDVIIGGGILGTSLAYRLSKKNPICLIEKNTIGSGTTANSAGIIITNHKNNIANKMAEITYNDINSFNINFSQVGTIDVKENINTKNGYIDPNDLAYYYANRAKQNGSYIIDNTKVSNIYKDKDIDKVSNIYKDKDIDKDKDKVKDINYIIKINNDEYICAKNIYNMTGISAQNFINKRLNVAYIRSHFWEFIPKQDIPERPILLLPGLYIKFQKNKIEVGIQEKKSFVLDNPNGEIPNEAFDILIKYNTILNQYFDIDNAFLSNYIYGISTYTPDGLPVIERTNNNFLTISGCCGYGITWSGGIAKLISENSEYLKKMDNNRFDNLTNREIKEKSQLIRHTKLN
jgi:glycine/D-amino acid oxidase-like deaminating enzyme